jgi:rhamnulokinase
MKTLLEARVAAVDLGAASGRVVAGHYSGHRFTLREVHRFPNVPVRVSGVLRWDVLRLFHGVIEGLRRAEREMGSLDSVGVDGWGVDYGLLDKDGQLLGSPAHYRDQRTAGAAARVLDMLGGERLYAATGTQVQPFNTLFQLYTDRGSAQFAAAKSALLLPDLISYWLTGEAGTELTNASTTGLLDPRTLDWASGLAGLLGLPVSLFPGLRSPGTVLGPIRADVAADAGLTSRPLVITVPSHDTAAAVAGVPAQSGSFAYVCTGTWVLVGMELPRPVTTDEARLANFTNEVGIDRTIRFLRNVTGFWLLQECLRHWRACGLPIDINELTEAAGHLTSAGVIDVQDPALAAAEADMPARIAAACQRASGIELHEPAEIARCVLDSMAVAIRRAIHDAGRICRRPADVVHVVGGGAANALFCQLVADACRLPVLAGPVEAAAWGNALSQARALGAITGSKSGARAVIRRSEPGITYAPRASETMWRRLEDIVLEDRRTRA